LNLELVLSWLGQSDVSRAEFYFLSEISWATNYTLERLPPACRRIIGGQTTVATLPVHSAFGSDD
jgi:hypothetical protein